MIGIQSFSYTRGFQMTFANGWTVSVQFGSGNCCANSNLVFGDSPIPSKCENAEISAWDKNNNLLKFSNNDSSCETYKGYCSANEIADFIAAISKL